MVERSSASTGFGLGCGAVFGVLAGLAALVVLVGAGCIACLGGLAERAGSPGGPQSAAERDVGVAAPSREPIVPREPGAPGPRPSGTWVGTGGANPLEPEAMLSDRRGGDSWDVEITFGNERIGIRYPSLECEGELTPLAETSRRLEYRERLSQGCGNARLARSGGWIVLERIAQDALWFNWQTGGSGPVGATASLRPR